MVTLEQKVRSSGAKSSSSSTFTTWSTVGAPGASRSTSNNNFSFRPVTAQYTFEGKLAHKVGEMNQAMRRAAVDATVNAYTAAKNIGWQTVKLAAVTWPFSLGSLTPYYQDEITARLGIWRNGPFYTSLCLGAVELALAVKGVTFIKNPALVGGLSYYAIETAINNLGRIAVHLKTRAPVPSVYSVIYLPANLALTGARKIRPFKNFVTKTYGIAAKAVSGVYHSIRDRWNDFLTNTKYAATPYTRLGFGGAY